MTKKYMLTDSFFCYCTSTEGTYITAMGQFGKCARFPIFRLKANILSSFQTNVLSALFRKNTHY